MNSFIIGEYIIYPHCKDNILNILHLSTKTENQGELYFKGDNVSVDSFFCRNINS